MKEKKQNKKKNTEKNHEIEFLCEDTDADQIAKPITAQSTWIEIQLKRN